MVVTGMTEQALGIKIVTFVVHSQQPVFMAVFSKNRCCLLPIDLFFLVLSSQLSQLSTHFTSPYFYLFTYLCNRSVSHCLSVCPGIRSSLAEQNRRAHQSSTHRLGLISLSQCASSSSTSPTITTCPHISLRCFHHHHHHFSRIHHHHHHHQHGLFRFVSAF